MSAPCAHDWALVRVVPRVERGEFVNAGAIVHCRQRGFLGARIALPRERLLALFPGADVELIEAHLAAIPLVARGGDEAGPIGRLPMTDRFHWLVAPRSTIVQTSPVHVGLAEDPEQALERLIQRYVVG